MFFRTLFWTAVLVKYCNNYFDFQFCLFLAILSRNIPCPTGALICTLSIISPYWSMASVWASANNLTEMSCCLITELSCFNNIRKVLFALYILSPSEPVGIQFDYRCKKEIWEDCEWNLFLDFLFNPIFVIIRGRKNFFLLCPSSSLLQICCISVF